MKKNLTNDQQRLVCDNLILAEKVAQQFGGSILRDKHEKSITMDDLKQEAIFGLCEAATHYDASQGVAFTTFAYFYCQKRVSIAVCKFGTPLSVPKDFSEDVDLVHFDATMDSVAEGYADCDDDGSPADRLNYRIYELEQVENEAKQSRHHLLKQGLIKLTAKEQMVLNLLFGIDDEPLDVVETAKALGVVPGRITQIKQQALRKLEIILQNL